MNYILGAGALGCLWAARLSQTQSTRFLFSPDYIARRPGASNPKGNFPLAYSSNTSPNQTLHTIAQSLLGKEKLAQGARILICTKSYDTVSAANTLKPYLNPSHAIILFQNGMGSQQAIAKLLEDNPVYAAVTTEGAYKKSGHHVHHAGQGHTELGAINAAAEKTEISKLVADLSLSGLIVKESENIDAALFNKLLINCSINAFTAITGLQNGEIRNSELFQMLWPSLRKELSQLSHVKRRIRSEAEIEKNAFAVMQKTAHNRSSMLQDIDAKRKTEIDFINGYAAEQLHLAGFDASTNNLLREKVHALGG